MINFRDVSVEMDFIFIELCTYVLCANDKLSRKYKVLN